MTYNIIFLVLLLLLMFSKKIEGFNIKTNHGKMNLYDLFNFIEVWQLHEIDPNFNLDYKYESDVYRKRSIYNERDQVTDNVIDILKGLKHIVKTSYYKRYCNAMGQELYHGQDISFNLELHDYYVHESFKVNLEVLMHLLTIIAYNDAFLFSDIIIPEEMGTMIKEFMNPLKQVRHAIIQLKGTSIYNRYMVSKKYAHRSKKISID